MRKLYVAFGLLVLLPAAALAQPVPVTFQARVTSVNGVDAATFSVGDPITISYGVDTAVADSNADPKQGVFFGASQDLSVSFPTRNVSALGTSGPLQTFNNVEIGNVISDQIFVFSGPIASASTLGGSPILSAEVDYLSDFLTLPAEPMMISTDALPVTVPPFDDAFVILTTANGSTFIHFETVAGPTVQIRANGSDGPVTVSAGAALTVDIQFDAPGTGLAAANVAIGVVTPSAVVWLGPTGFTTTPTAVYSGPLDDFGPTPLFSFPSTAGFPPGSYTFFMLVQDPGTGTVTADLVEVIIG